MLRNLIPLLILAGSSAQEQKIVPDQPPGEQPKQIYIPSFPPPPPDPNEFQITSGTELVLLDVSVKDARGGFVSGLTKDDFSVKENGKPQKITTFASQDIPVTVGLVVDNSGSMGPKRADVVTAALTFVQESHPLDEIFVINFNDKVRIGLPPDTPFTDDIPTLRKALLSNATVGRTALYDATSKALEQLNKGKRDKKTLIVISDGGDNISHESFNDLLHEALTSRATIYTIGIFDSDDPDRNPGVLRRLAALTGGEAYFPHEMDAMVDVCRRIAKDIRNRYTVGYEPENRNYDNAVRKIQVTASSPEHPRLNIRTRTSYIASNAALLTKNKPKETK